MVGLIAKAIHPMAKSHTFLRTKSDRNAPATIPKRIELHFRQARSATFQTLGFSNFISNYSSGLVEDREEAGYGNEVYP